MCEQGELETLRYRALWLEDAHTLGQIGCILADATGWQPTDDDPLPDALELALVATRRLAELEQAVSVYQPKLRGRREREYA